MQRVNKKNISIAVLVFFLFGFLTIFFCTTFISFLYPMKYKDEIKIYANQYNVSPALVASIINTESRFRANAVSPKNAIGLMQILPSTGEFIANRLNLEYKDEMLFVPETNIKFGCYYLNYLSKKFTNQDTLIMAYNAGEGVVNNWLSNSDYSIDKISLISVPYKETTNYLTRVNKSLSYYKNKF